MKETKTIPMLIESNMGHDTKQVSLGDIQSEVEAELKKDKWVTVEHSDGSSELLTKQDIPDADLVNEDDEESVEETDDRDEEDIEADEDAKDQELLAGFKKDTGKAKPINKKTPTKPTTPSVKEEWSSKFEDITSCVATTPAKGG